MAQIQARPWSGPAVGSFVCAVGAVALLVTIVLVEQATNTGESASTYLFVIVLMFAAVGLGLVGLVQTMGRRRQRGRFFAIVGFTIGALMIAAIILFVWAASQIEF